ncbi:MAG: hypothetical protein IJ612_00665 [Prevotella sp.]|nr:hypothetical protein [Prevotella sp.]
MIEPRGELRNRVLTTEKRLPGQRWLVTAGLCIALLTGCSVADDADYMDMPANSDASMSIRYEGVWKIDGQAVGEHGVAYSMGIGGQLLFEGFPFTAIASRMLPDSVPLTANDLGAAQPPLTPQATELLRHVLTAYGEQNCLQTYRPIELHDVGFSAVANYAEMTGPTDDTVYKYFPFAVMYADGNDCCVLVLCVVASRSTITFDRSQDYLSCNLTVKKVVVITSDHSQTECDCEPEMRLTFTSTRKTNDR